MNRHADAISAQLSLRAPQRELLEILARIAELVPLSKQYDLETSLLCWCRTSPSITS